MVTKSKEKITSYVGISGKNTKKELPKEDFKNRYFLKLYY